MVDLQDHSTVGSIEVVVEVVEIVEIEEEEEAIEVEGEAVSIVEISLEITVASEVVAHSRTDIEETRTVFQIDTTTADPAMCRSTLNSTNTTTAPRCRLNLNDIMLRLSSIRIINRPVRKLTNSTATRSNMAIHHPHLLLNLPTSLRSRHNSSSSTHLYKLRLVHTSIRLSSRINNNGVHRRRRLISGQILEDGNSKCNRIYKRIMVLLVTAHLRYHSSNRSRTWRIF